MNPDHDRVSRRRFLATTVAALGAGSALAGCSELSGGRGLDAPDYDMDAVRDLFTKGFPSAPPVFPVDIPAARFDAHESRTRELLEVVPESPDIPNETIANKIAADRERLVERIDEREIRQAPLERLDRWRYYRASAAEIWGAYVAATDQYDSRDFRSRYERLRSEYTDFDETWDYRGRNPAIALVVHRTLERLFSRGKDAVLSTGPFPSDPQEAVFETGRMLRDHEGGAASLADARSVRTQYLSGQSEPPSQRLRFVATSERLFRSQRFERPSDEYQQALEEGPAALDVALEQGPDAAAFESARRYARHGDRIVREAWEKHEPADATVRAARYRLTRPVFRETVDAILANEITWPDDVSGLRELRAETIEVLEDAWSTDPRPLAVELTATPVDVLGSVAPHRYDSIDEGDIARYVGTLHHVKRLAARIPNLTQTVEDTLEAV